MTLHEAHDELGYQITERAPIDVKEVLAAAVQGLLCVVHDLVAFLSWAEPIRGLAVHVELMVADMSFSNGVKPFDDTVVMMMVMGAIECLVEEDLMEGLI